MKDWSKTKREKKKIKDAVKERATSGNSPKSKQNIPGFGWHEGRADADLHTFLGQTTRRRAPTAEAEMQEVENRTSHSGTGCGKV